MTRLGFSSSSASGSPWPAESEGHVARLRSALAERADVATVDDSLAPMASHFLSRPQQFESVLSPFTEPLELDGRELAACAGKLRDRLNSAAEKGSPGSVEKLRKLCEVIDRYAALHEELMARSARIDM